MDIRTVVKDNKCVSCGNCYSVCSANAISMKYIESIGFFRPILNQTSCVGCGNCYKYCPAINRHRSTSLIGNYKRIVLAHSVDYFVRHESTSGGVVNSLVRYLLSNNIVEGVIMTGYDSGSDIEASPCLITMRNVGDLIKNTRDYSSRYVLVPLLKSLKEVSLINKRIAVVGTPCQIHAIKLGGGNTNVELFTIGITCSGGISYKATEQYKHLNGMPKAKMFYRGDGWPGKNCLMSDNKKIENKHPGSLFETMFSSQIFKNPGCRECMDHFAEQADISFCDFWNAEEISTETEGNSCVIIRSQKALEYFSLMEKQDFIIISGELSEKDVIDTQLNVLKIKKGNLNGSVKYYMFNKLVDYIFKNNIYKKFGIKTYRKFCLYYNRICKKIRI